MLEKTEQTRIADSIAQRVVPLKATDLVALAQALDFDGNVRHNRVQWSEIGTELGAEADLDAGLSTGIIGFDRWLRVRASLLPNMLFPTFHKVQGGFLLPIRSRRSQTQRYRCRSSPILSQ